MMFHSFSSLYMYVCVWSWLILGMYSCHYENMKIYLYVCLRAFAPSVLSAYSFRFMHIPVCISLCAHFSLKQNFICSCQFPIRSNSQEIRKRKATEQPTIQVDIANYKLFASLRWTPHNNGQNWSLTRK